MSGPPRRWLEVAVAPPPGAEAEAALVDGLIALGGRAVEVREGGWLVTHVDEPPDLDRFMESTRSALAAGVAPAEVRVVARWRPHEEWSETWKRGLATRRITKRLLVTPSWLPVEAREGEIVLVVDPGMAFGTAEHGTTRGCLRLLDAAVRSGDRVLDVGAGSGILAVAAARLGAEEVVALEGDPLAWEAAEENLARNGAVERVVLERRWADAAALAALAPRDGAVANIEPGTLLALLPGFRSALRPGGWLVLSGITAPQWDSFRVEVEAAGFRTASVDAVEDGWRSARFVVGGQ